MSYQPKSPEDSQVGVVWGVIGAGIIIVGWAAFGMFLAAGVKSGIEAARRDIARIEQPR